MRIEKAKEQGYHPSMEIREVKKQNNQWKYRKRKIMKTTEKKEKLMKRFHNNP